MNKIYLEDFRFLLSQKLPWENLRNKTLLITGASGFIASYLIKFLLFLNKEMGLHLKVIGIVRNKKNGDQKFAEYKKSQDLKILVQDIANPLKIKEKVHFIIHAASQASPKYYNLDPVGTLKANVLGTYNLLELAKNNPLESFLFLSSGEIYGMTPAKKITNETSYGYLDPLNIRSCYGESKRLGETLCVSYSHQYQIPAKIVRLYHTYGPGVNLNDGRVFADFIKNILTNENIVLKSSGKTTRSFSYIADTVCGLFTVLFKGKNQEAYNLANENATVSIKELAETLIKLFPQKKLKMIFEKRDKKELYSESKITDNNPDTKKLSSLGWQPHFSLKEGFKRTIESYN
ncbi:MAG: NAD-dependent epimerase/dehydratase family protein [Patescibacteria group bacterium]|nr:NAD-dependent epimerase/dehydratase family protein [Patescibacteria group bacterium]MCL5095161.1 NAD-dependent epimerase/dehydratase family protein [Patescibacteria group bacterium]